MVQDFQHFDQTSNSTLAKLLEVDSELASQEVDLSSQLQSVQEKRRSLKTVISLFAPADTAAATPAVEPVHTQSAATDKQPEQAAEDLATPQLETLRATTSAADSDTLAVQDTQDQGAKKSQSPVRRQTTKSTRTMKTARKTEGWQDYMREEFSQTVLPEAVSTVLQRQPGRVLEIAAIVDAIFVDEIPKEARSRARERVSNILSEGARKNKWYRGQAGSYTMSKAAT